MEEGEGSAEVGLEDGDDNNEPEENLSEDSSGSEDEEEQATVWRYRLRPRN